MKTVGDSVPKSGSGLGLGALVDSMKLGGAAPAKPAAPAATGAAQTAQTTGAGATTPWWQPRNVTAAPRVAVAAVPAGADPLVMSPEDVAQAVRAAPVPPANHPYAQYVNGLRAQLSQMRLPTRADGVRIFDIGEAERPGRPMNEHTSMVAQTMVGSLGLANGADLKVLRHTEGADPIQAPMATLNDIGELATRLMASHLNECRAQLSAVMERVPNDGRTTLVNMSVSADAISNAATLARFALNSPPGSPMAADVARMLGHPATAADLPQITQFILPRVRAALMTSPAPVRAAAQALAQDVAAARQRGVLFMKAAGNRQELADRLNAPDAAHEFDSVPGMIVVGAVDLGRDPLSPADDSVARFSVRGATLGAVGVRVPLNGRDQSGTSFSTPFVTSVAALMLKANPRLTPDQLEQILKDTSRPVRGGLNQVDVVRAVARAAGRE